MRGEVNFPGAIFKSGSSAGVHNPPGTVGWKSSGLLVFQDGSADDFLVGPFPQGRWKSFDLLFDEL
jgi:hypothetical protein